MKFIIVPIANLDMDNATGSAGEKHEHLFYDGG